MTWESIPWDAVGALATVVGLIAGAISKVLVWRRSARRNNGAT